MHRVLIVALLMLALASRASAQTVTATTGAINGSVSDSTKAVLPGVTVTLSGPSLMGAHTAVTDHEGAYRFSAVPRGDYKLTFELSGFGTVVREGINVSLGFTATVNAEMSPGTVSENVTVSHFDATMRVYGASTLATVPSLKTHWVDEARFFTPYMRDQMRKRAEARRAPQPRPPGSLRDFPELFKHKVPELKAFYDAGGGRLLTVGTDNPTGGPDLAGFAYHRELQAIVYAGLPPVAALKAATINGARALGVSDRLGSIEPGKIADLYVAVGNPLARIEDARDVRLVMKAGQIYDPKALLQSADGQIGPSGPNDHARWQIRR